MSSRYTDSPSEPQTLHPRNALAPPRNTPPPARRNKLKVALQPGYSALDWAILTNSSADLRQVPWPGLIKVTRDELERHASAADAWTAIRGKVYNLTKYFPFHPGGEQILLQAAGKDSTALFNKYHAWVNVDHVLAKCLVGFLVDSG